MKRIIPILTVALAGFALPAAQQQTAGERAAALKATMEASRVVLRQYFPPDHVRIQAAKDAGNVSIRMLDPGKKARLTFSSYYKSGDSFSIDVDLSNNHPLAANVNTTMDSDRQKVTLVIKFATLDNGTVYTSEAVLNIKSKKLMVTVTDSGYRKTNP